MIKTISVFLMILLSRSLFAQSNLTVVDFYVLEKPAISSGNDTSSVRLEIIIRCRDFSRADSVFLRFGSMENVNIMTASASVIQDGSSYKLVYNGDELPVLGNIDARMNISMSKQIYASVSYVSIRIKDDSGDITDPENYQLAHTN